MITVVAYVNLKKIGVSEPELKTNFQKTGEETLFEVSIIAQNLEIPWAIDFLPNGNFLITERPGRVRLVTKRNGLESQPVLSLNEVAHVGEGGLLGIAVHPKFSENQFVYLYYTYFAKEGETLNRVARFKFDGRLLTEQTVIVDKIPGASNHNGGRIKFGPDGYLYITTGDAQNPSQAQDKNSLAGKILRIRDDGGVPSDNPFSNLVYSYSHRNPQGLTWDSDGILWETEHGPSGGIFGTGQDEFNRIEIGKNYGWPQIIGDQKKTDMEQPVFHSGDDTWAPAGTAYYRYSDNKYSIFFAGLRGQALYEMEFSQGNTLLRTHFKGEFGRIREVVLGPDNMLYITTSNRDGRGTPKTGDDKIIRINPVKF